jgi:hypothetical protein
MQRDRHNGWSTTLKASLSWRLGLTCHPDSSWDRRTRARTTDSSLISQP